MRFHFWHTTLSLFFTALVALAVLWLDALGRLAAFIPLTDFALMALAVFRLTRLFTYDSITAFIRDWFLGHDPQSLRGALGTLINCPWCTSLWFALMVVFFYYLTPYAWYVILILALSALGSLLSLIVNWLGWSAEAQKREAQSMPLPR